MTATYTPIKIIVADDHPLYRKSLKKVVIDTPEFSLVADADNGQKLIELAEELRPDVIITDLKMPLLDGFEATRQIHLQFPSIGIIGISMLDNAETISRMLDAGAKGYLLKNVDAEEIVEAVKTVYNNETYFSKEIKNCFSEKINTDNYPCFKKLFSEKEIKIIKLICRGYCSKEIASELTITKKAVDGIRENILKKIHAKNAADVVMYATKNHIC